MAFRECIHPLVCIKPSTKYVGMPHYPNYGTEIVRFIWRCLGASFCQRRDKPFGWPIFERRSCCPDFSWIAFWYLSISEIPQILSSTSLYLQVFKKRQMAWCERHRSHYEFKHLHWGPVISKLFASASKFGSKVHYSALELFDAFYGHTYVTT